MLLIVKLILKKKNEEYLWFICGLQVKTVTIWPLRKIVTLSLRPLRSYGNYLTSRKMQYCFFIHSSIRKHSWWQANLFSTAMLLGVDKRETIRENIKNFRSFLACPSSNKSCIGYVLVIKNSYSNPSSGLFDSFRLPSNRDLKQYMDKNGY